MSFLADHGIDVLDVAGYLVAHSEKATGHPFTNLKLQKLIYYALALRGKELFHSPLLAWDRGPVVPKVYDRYKDGSRPIAPPLEFETDPYLPEDRELLDAILATYGRLSAGRLCGMTHSETPWFKTYNIGRNTPIAIPDLTSFFSGLVEMSRQGRSENGRPIFPVASLQHQKRRELGVRMELHRERLRSIVRDRPAAMSHWPDDES